MAEPTTDETTTSGNGSAATTKTATPLAVGKAYFGAVEAKDVDAMVACWHPGGSDCVPGEELIAPDGIREYFEALFAAFPDFRFEVTDFSASRDVCFAHWRATGTFAGSPFMDLEPTGAHIDISGIDKIKVRDGLIERNDAYFDAAGMARQLGAMPPQGSPTEQRMFKAVNARTRLTRRLAAAEPEQIADGVHLIRGGLQRTMNVYLIEDGGEVTVFDAGEKGMAPAILAAAARLGGIKQVVLGHADTDHRGSAPALRATGVPILCHPDAVEQAQGSGGRDYWHRERLPRLQRAVHNFSHEHVWDGGPVQIDGTVSEGDEVAGFKVVDLPGHAPGLIGLWRESDRLALVTDCFYLLDMWGRPKPPMVPNEAYNLDTEQARVSLRKLAELDPLTAAPGHLGPLTGPDVREQLLRAADAA